MLASTAVPTVPLEFVVADHWSTIAHRTAPLFAPNPDHGRGKPGVSGMVGGGLILGAMQGLYLYKPTGTATGADQGQERAGEGG